MGVLRQLVVDCERPAALARFWEAALDGFAVRAYDDDEMRRLASLGFTPETDPTVILDGEQLEICFQRVEPVERSSKRPLHLDVVTSARRTEVERLRALGARVVETFDNHTWMRDPEGNDFCLVDQRPRS